MVFFDQKSSKNTELSDDFRSKMNIVDCLKLVKFNRTPAFYLRGYGTSITIHLLSKYFVKNNACCATKEKYLYHFFIVNILLSDVIHGCP